MENVGGGTDYDSGPYSVTFNAEVTEVPFNVSIHDDNILEGNETFDLTINQSSLPNRVDVNDPAQATVIIVDDDGNYIVKTIFVADKCMPKNEREQSTTFLQIQLTSSDLSITI